MSLPKAFTANPSCEYGCTVSQQASQQTTRKSQPYLQDKLAREAELRGSEFFNELLTQHTSPKFGLLSQLQTNARRGHLPPCRKYQKGQPMKDCP